MMDLEICIDSVEGAFVAAKHSAKRVELCSALSEGGLTPSIGMIEACVKAGKSEVHVMIRPSAGGFVYTANELQLMERDMRAAASVGAVGIVFGILTPDFKVDIQKNMLLMETAIELGLATTFHRAIDLCPNPIEALENLIHIGFKRILTSGGNSLAEQGIDQIKALYKHANGRIEIMAGSGINPENAHLFMQSGIDAVHCTAKKSIPENLTLEMGPKYQVDEPKIRSIRELIDQK